MAAKKPEAVKETKEAPPEPEKPAEVPGWPGVIAETPEEHEARRKAEAETNT
jgi:hypothetical protein